MEKAFDPAALLEKVKGNGLVVAEAGAEALALGVFEWLEESFALSENKYDDMLGAALLPAIKAKAFEAINKVDGIEG
jgi:hypothetical protein